MYARRYVHTDVHRKYNRARIYIHTFVILCNQRIIKFRDIANDLILNYIVKLTAKYIKLKNRSKHVAPMLCRIYMLSYIENIDIIRQINSTKKWIQVSIPVWRHSKENNKRLLHQSLSLLLPHTFVAVSFLIE